jgi:hypothetical protein
MAIWRVKEVFVRTSGATELSSKGLDRAAARIKEQVSAEEVSAYGRGDRFVVTARVEAANRPAALAWGRSTLYGVVTDVLDGWSLMGVERMRQTAPRAAGG